MFSTVYICTFKVILTRVWQHHDVDYIHQIWKKNDLQYFTPVPILKIQYTKSMIYIYDVCSSVQEKENWIPVH